MGNLSSKFSLPFREAKKKNNRIQNAIMATSTVSFHRYFIGTFFGSIPEQVILAYFGTTLRKLSDIVKGDVTWEQKAMFGAQVLFVVILLVVVTYIGKKALNSVTAEQVAKEAAEAAASESDEFDVEIDNQEDWVEMGMELQNLTAEELANMEPPTPKGDATEEKAAAGQHQIAGISPNVFLDRNQT
eukprot:TRINITY_DN2306_c0_g1_i2.p1 TRINITY_DN2306_c0_g1~~TRINITY_DN2306_c0_g1_i2.p1  ORF type:complete len:187 (-),score=37.58 TRINITY_DN2306_c0_g1_i2:11-571(-)